MQLEEQMRDKNRRKGIISLDKRHKKITVIH